MDLLKAVQSRSLKEVKKAVRSQGILADSDWTDYKALNTALANGDIDIAKFLLSKNSRVNNPTITNVLESTPLHKAVDFKDVELVRLLLQKKASISTTTSGRNTPLHLAFLAGHTEIVNLLLQHIDETSDLVNCKNDFDLSHMHIACTTENDQVIEKYLKTNINIDDAVNKDSLNWAGYTAFHFAVTYRSSPALLSLLAAMPSGHEMQEDNDGYTPWDLACTRFVEYSIMMHHMSKHQNRDNITFEYTNRLNYALYHVGGFQCVEKPTAFHLACMRDDPHLVKIYLEHGAPVNVGVGKRMKRCPWYSPLHFAVEGKCKENVQVLLDKGADVTHVNGHKMTALHLAMYNVDWKPYWNDLADELADVEAEQNDTNPNDRESIVDLLYSKVEKKEENLKDKNGLGYLHIAVTRNDLPLVKKILDAVNSQVLANDRGFSLYTPLHFAVQYGHREMVKLLIDRGADVNAVSSEGTALQMAIRSGLNHVIELLLDVPGIKTDMGANEEPLMHTLIRAATRKEFDNIRRYLRTMTGQIIPFPKLVDYVERLVELGCDVNAKDENGNTALHLVRDNKLCIKLLENGADVNLENHSGIIPFDYNPHFNRALAFRVNPCNMELYNHVKNFMAVGVKVNSLNERYCGDIDDLKKDKHERHVMQQTRTAEVEQMKREKIDEKTTFYDFMKLEDEATGVYARNEALRRIVEDKNRYSVYGYLIKLQYRKSQKYAETSVTRKRSSTNKDSEENLSKRKRAK